jgi:hypothetical protein
VATSDRARCVWRRDEQMTVEERRWKRHSASVSEVLGSSGVRAMDRRTECERTDLYVESDT